MFAAKERGDLTFQQGQVTGLVGEGGDLKAAVVKGPDGDVEIAATRLLPFFGLTMKLGPVAEWGLNLHENLIAVDTASFESSEPGIFAIGDINTYPGKLKLILSRLPRGGADVAGGQEGGASQPAVVFQYTTSSTSLQKKLGVA